jgi:hypothetical protein
VAILRLDSRHPAASGFMKICHRGLVVLLVALVVHASFLAALPLVWCVGANQHRALELSVVGGHHGHHPTAVVQGVARHTSGSIQPKELTLASDTHPIDCIDTAPIHSFSNVSYKVQFTALCAQIAIVAPFLSRALDPQPAPRLIYPRSFEERNGSLQLAQLRSIILLI